MEINYNALKFALLRAFLPTISVFLIILICTLNIETTFQFLIGKEFINGAVRMIIMAAEICWVWYSYNYYLKNKK